MSKPLTSTDWNWLRYLKSPSFCFCVCFFSIIPGYEVNVVVSSYLVNLFYKVLRGCQWSSLLPFELHSSWGLQTASWINRSGCCKLQWLFAAVCSLVDKRPRRVDHDSWQLRGRTHNFVRRTERRTNPWRMKRCLRAFPHSFKYTNLPEPSLKAISKEWQGSSTAGGNCASTNRGTRSLEITIKRVKKRRGNRRGLIFFYFSSSCSLSRTLVLS